MRIRKKQSQNSRVLTREKIKAHIRISFYIMSTKSIPLEHQLDWIIKNPDHTPISFFKRFGFTNKQLAHHAYFSALRKLSERKDVSDGTKAAIARHLEMWNSTEVKDSIEEFWNSKRLKLNKTTYMNNLEESTYQMLDATRSRVVKEVIRTEIEKCNSMIEDDENNVFLEHSNIPTAIAKDSEKEREGDAKEDEDDKIESQESEEDYEIDEDSEDNGEDGKNKNTNFPKGVGAELTDESRRQYENVYKTMDDKLKWKLKSGRTVEDIIYGFGNSCRFEHLAHSFTIDLKDQEISTLFTKEEREELESTNFKDDPELDEDTEACINAFAKTNLSEIREVMKEFVNRLGADYNPQKDFSIEAITYAIRSLVLLYERQPNALDKDHHESWYNINIWGPIIDKALGGIKGIDIARGESCSVASAERKAMNQERKSTERKPIGRRGDAIIRKYTNGRVLEYGGAKAGRFYHGEKGSKWLIESGVKLPKMLRDMFFGLCAKVKWQPQIVRKLETIGYIHGGLVLMIMTLDNPAGYVTRITKSDLYEIPADVESFASALELIAAVWITKLRVQRTVQLMQSIPLDLKNIGLKKRKVAECQIPKSFTTPKKKKGCRRFSLVKS